jgi:hypothetical protein
MHVQRQLIVIPDQMLPKPALPNPLFTPSQVAVRDVTRGWRVARETRFNQSPALGVIVVTFRQCPDHMEFAWQNNRGINGKRPTMATQPSGIPQQINMRNQKVRTLILQAGCEEVSTTRHTKATIIRHPASIAQLG